MKILIAHFNAHWVDTAGGVEKVVCKFANEMVQRGHEVTILYVDKQEGNPYFPLDKSVKTYNILFEHGKKIISKLPVSVQIYREIYRLFSIQKVRSINAKYKGKAYGNQIAKYIKRCQPDVVVATSGQSIKYVIQDAACAVPVVGMIHSDCYESIPNLSDEELQAMGKCKAIQVLLPSFIIPCKKYIKDTHFVAIGNTVEPAVAFAELAKKKEQYKIVCVGSITGRKNQKLLADAFALISQTYPQWECEFWGDYKSNNGIKIKKYIERKNISHIKVMGTTKNITNVYANADIFCLPSYAEGFPLALTEAMAIGLPSVGLKRCNAVSALISDGENGYLVDDTPQALANALKKLICHQELRNKMGKNAKIAMEAYRPEIIWGKWEDLLRTVKGKG